MDNAPEFLRNRLLEALSDEARALIPKTAAG
jgi:hypothetical protein